MATDTQTQVIVGLDRTTRGSDQGQLVPMVEPLQCRYAQPPQEMLVDGGYARLADIEHVAFHTKVYAPVPKPKDESRDPHAPLPGDAAAVAQWRARMGTEEAPRRSTRIERRLLNA